MGRHRQPFAHLTRLPLAAIVPPSGEPPPAEAVERLAAALKRQGQREPVLVLADGKGAKDAREAGGRLVVGRLRLAAARRLGWRELEAVLLDASFAPEVAAIERLQAGDGEPWQLADALRRLQERCGWTQTQVGVAIGRNRDFVASLLALTAIEPDVRAYLEAQPGGRTLSARHLRYIGRAPRERQLALARQILDEGVSTKVLEERQRRGPRRRQYIKVRELRQPRARRGPSTTREWRRYYRKLRTDLRRIDAQEARELRRSDEQIAQARQRQRLTRDQARVQRRALDRELRRATRELTRRGEL
jgi:ParB-like chromosome segregation protein Spo0J